ncbi:hypothetical protein KIPB_011385, partial [Kipferlia bialata]|eukprot:g11385.t1
MEKRHYGEFIPGVVSTTGELGPQAYPFLRRLEAAAKKTSQKNKFKAAFYRDWIGFVVKIELMMFNEWKEQNTEADLKNHPD